MIPDMSNEPVNERGSAISFIDRVSNIWSEICKNNSNNSHL